MDKILEIVKWALDSGPNLISAVNAVLLALVAVFILIPGDQPEKAIKGIADFIGKFSKK